MTALDQARQIIATATGRNAADVSGSARMGEADGWDSLGHMRIIAEAERHLGRTLTAMEAVSIEDVASLARVIEA